MAGNTMKRFVCISLTDYYCRQYLSRNFAMVHHIIKLRNEHVKECMRELDTGEDPNNSGGTDLDKVPCRPKKALVDKLPPVIAV